MNFLGILLGVFVLGIRWLQTILIEGQGEVGIARPGMIVTSEGLTLTSLKKDPDFSLFHGLAHEIAHFWWNIGSGRGIGSTKPFRCKKWIRRCYGPVKNWFFFNRLKGEKAI